MRGFFDKSKLQVKGEIGGKSCAACGLYKSAKSPKLAPYGDFKKRIMVIGEAPGPVEDEKGRPWQGPISQTLRRKYQKLGIRIFEDCVSLNAVSCRPTDNDGKQRTPTPHEIECCRQKVYRAIKKYKPKVIITHGTTPIQTLIEPKWGGELGGIMRWRGYTIPDHEFGAWICPTFHPSFVEHQEEKGESEARIIWENDIRRALDMTGIPLPPPVKSEDIIVTDDVGAVLKKINVGGTRLAFDIETTGLRPYRTDLHRIVSISFCNESGRAYAIPFPTKKKHLRALKAIMENPEIRKIAANMKYEDTWLKILHNIDVLGWEFDTMLATHILDNRPGINGLEFQAFVCFGVERYSEDVAPYLRTSGEEEVNRIDDLWKTKAGREKLLRYNGMDSLLTFRLAHLQIQMMEMGLYPCLNETGKYSIIR